jgi:hypothetical protein
MKAWEPENLSQKGRFAYDGCITQLCTLNDGDQAVYRALEVPMGGPVDN